MKSLIPALLAGGLLLVGQACFAEDQWAGPMGTEFGLRAKAELAALPENGRTAFRKALIACSLHVDEPSNAGHKEDCKTAFTVFTVAFSNEKSAISLLFNNAIIAAEVWEANIELTIQQGRREPPGANPGKADIADLEKIYHDAALHPSSAAITPKTVQPSARTTILIPLRRNGGEYVVTVVPDDVIHAQGRLIDLGYMTGPPDGIWGTKSRMDLRAFRIANGLAADDKWDDLVSDRLYSTQAVRSPLPLATR